MGEIFDNLPPKLKIMCVRFRGHTLFLFNAYCQRPGAAGMDNNQFFRFFEAA